MLVDTSKLATLLISGEVDLIGLNMPVLVTDIAEEFLFDVLSNSAYLYFLVLIMFYPVYCYYLKGNKSLFDL